jgi:hypothetical protein
MLTIIKTNDNIMQRISGQTGFCNFLGRRLEELRSIRAPRKLELKTPLNLLG